MPESEAELRARIKAEREAARAAHWAKIPEPEMDKTPKWTKKEITLADLQQQRAKVVEELEAARREGDLSENAGYHAAKEKLSFLDAQIRKGSKGQGRNYVAGQKVKLATGEYQIITSEPDFFLAREVKGHSAQFYKIPKISGGITTVPRVDFTPEQANHYLDLFYTYFPDTYMEYHGKLKRLGGDRDPSSIELINLLNIESPKEFQETLASYFRIYGEK